MPRFVNNQTIERRERMPPRKDHMARGSKRLRRGRTEWDGVREREVKPLFARMGVTRCEAGFKDCTGDNYLGFAHTLKRRHIVTAEDMRAVALLCANCHLKLELQGEARMKSLIEKIIERRVFRLAELEAA